MTHDTVPKKKMQKYFTPVARNIAIQMNVEYILFTLQIAENIYNNDIL